MLKGLYITNANNETIPSDAINLVNNTELDLREVDGLGRPDAEMYTQEKIAVDASFYSGQTVKSRTITLSVKTQNDLYRMILYRMLGYNDKRRIFVETDAGVYWIDGYVKGATYAAKPAVRQEVEISIFCPYPWFRSQSLNKVPVALDGQYNSVGMLSNAGDVPAGIQLWYPAGHADTITSIECSGGSGALELSEEIRVESLSKDTLLLDTTPGDYYICDDVHGISIENVEIYGYLPTINPAALPVNVRAVGASTTGYIGWYDTWSGI